MGKMTIAILLVFAIELALALFFSSVPASVLNGHTPLYQFLVNPTAYASDAWYGSILSTVGAIAALIGTGLIIAGLFGFIRLEPIYAAMIVAIYVFILEIVKLWTAIQSQGVFGSSGWLVATVICSPLLIFYIMACMDYIRSPNG